MSWPERIKDTSALGGIPLGIAIAMLALASGHLLLFYQTAGLLALNYGVAAAIRTAWFEKRPDSTEKGKSWLSMIDASSFPSLHASRMFSYLVVFGNFFGVWAYALLLALALLVSYLRVRLKRHYWWDVLAGAIIGLFVGWFALQFSGSIAGFLHLPI
ncbi:MAG: phosphatase PAP2 family protein [DPANN group archaeon]|nr:phosphatase PAP2 family protein [DPANN group archaeon]